MRPLLFLIISFLLYSCESVEKLAYTLFLEEDLLKRPEAKRCSECHQDIYKQWKKSRHSIAWISEHFKKSSNNFSKVKCLSCHAPYEVNFIEEPVVRDFHREDGINCASCHFKDETKSMHGPYDVFSPPHYSKKDINYTKSGICAGCHKETYKEWKKTKSEKTCQDCHMPSKKGKLIQKFPFHLFHSKKDIHSHSFPVLKAEEDDISVKLKKEKDTLSVFLTNINIPHKLPTADQGKPKLYVKVEFFKDGKKVDEDSYMITHKEGINMDETKEIIFYPLYDYDSVRISVSRKLAWKKEKEEITKFLVPLRDGNND